MKQLLGNPVVQFLIGRTVGLYMALVSSTTRWRRVNRAAVEPYWRDGTARLVCCIWHGRFMQVHKMWTYGKGAPPSKILISRSREGGIVAHAAQFVGSTVVRGSAPKGNKLRGGAGAIRDMMRHLENGGAMGMTPDGPRGPRMRAKLAPVQLAKLAQAPILTLAWSTKWRIVLKSWDSFILPLPFGRGVLIWGDPIPAPAPDATAEEMERVRGLVESELNRISAEADRIVGVPMIEPAPAPARAETPDSIEETAAQETT